MMMSEGVMVVCLVVDDLCDGVCDDVGDGECDSVCDGVW